MATRSAPPVGAVTPGSVGSADGLHAALDVVAVEGWGGPAEMAVLDYARQRVVRRLVLVRGFTGHAIDEAVTTGLSVAWEVLSAPAVRT